MNYLPSITTELTKSQIQIVAEGYLDEVSKNGKIIELTDLIAKMEYLIKQIRENKGYVDEVRTELMKFGREYVTPSGTKIELAEVGTKYDFTHCGSTELQELEELQDNTEARIKSVKEFLKGLPDEGMMVLNQSTGELEMVFPPAKTSTSSFKTTLKK